MEKVNSPLISAAELLETSKDENLVLVDARGSRESYAEKHLKEAIFIDLNTQLSDIKEDPADGGRHPLASIDQFAETLAQLGITEKHQVVVYDDKNGAMSAARFWWMMRAIGHEKVYVLNGGLQAAITAGFPLNSGEEKANPAAPYPIQEWTLPMSTLSEIENDVAKEDHIVIDVREEERYNGSYEPIDLIAGHIPGAINVPFSTNLAEGGLFLSSEELKEKYQKIFNEIPIENVTVHCGSGVTACHTLLALSHAGMKIPSLYVGSWSEWSRNDMPIGTNL